MWTRCSSAFVSMLVIYFFNIDNKTSASLITYTEVCYDGSFVSACRSWWPSILSGQYHCVHQKAIVTHCSMKEQQLYSHLSQEHFSWWCDVFICISTGKLEVFVPNNRCGAPSFLLLCCPLLIWSVTREALACSDLLQIQHLKIWCHVAFLHLTVTLSLFKTGSLIPAFTVVTLFYYCMTFLIKPLLSFLLPAVTVRCLLLLPLPPCAGTGSQVKTWRGMMVPPPGPTTCLLACTRSCAKGRRVRNYALPPEQCTVIILNWWLSLTSPYLLYVWGSEH